MKKILLAGAATIALSSFSMAADPVVFEEVVAPPPPADIWDGVFIGLLGGYGWAQDGIKVDSYSYHDMTVRRRGRPGGPNPEIAAIGEPVPFDYSQFLSDEDSSWVSNDGDGWFGGGIIGFNVQNGNFVFGAEADISFSDISLGSAATSTTASVTWESGCDFWANCENPDEVPDIPFEKVALPLEDGVPLAPLTGTTMSTTHATAEVDWYGTARLKAGYAIDNVLAYVTGGLAFGEVKLNGSVNTTHSYGNGATTSQSVGFHDSSTEVGFALGAGLDVALTPNFIVGAFYQYVDLGSVSGGGSNSDSESYRAFGPLQCQVEPDACVGRFVEVNENGTGSGSASANANFHTIGIRGLVKFDSSGLFN